jgi:hypothetical protein
MAWSRPFLLRRGLRFLGLRSQERQLLLEALILLPVTALALRLVGYRRWQSFVAWRGLRTPCSRPKPAQTQDLARLAVSSLQRANRFSPRPASCLQQALALSWLLGRRGIASELRIGVRKQEGKFEAHAWLERHGQLLYDPGVHSASFLPFDSPIPPLGGRQR